MRPGRIALALALWAVVGWPLVATVAETTHALDRIERGMARLGWNGGAETLHRWRGLDPEIEEMPPATGGAGGVWRAGAQVNLAWNTIKVVAATEAIALPAGVLLALLLFRTDMAGRRLLLGLMAVAVFVPLPLHATGWIGALGNAGRSQLFGNGPILVGAVGAGFVHAMATLPWVVLLAGVGLRGVEPELEEAALLDLPAWRVVLRVTLRRAVGAIAAAALAVAVLTANDMTVTDLLVPRVETYAEEVYNQAHLNDEPTAAAFVAVPPMLVLGGLILLTTRWLLRSDPARVASAAARSRTWCLGRWRGPLGLLAVATAGGLVALPIFGLVWRAGRVGGSAVLGRAPHWSPGGLAATLRAVAPEMVGPLAKSATWAAVGASVAVALAWPLAWLSRRPGGWRWVAAAIAALALATPGPIVGMALVLAYNPPFLTPDASTLAKVDYVVRLLISDTPANLVLAYAIRTLPFALLVLWPALRTIPEAHLEAAELDGYGAGGQVRRVALPLTRGALFAAWAVAFVLALGELPAALMVEPPTWTPLVTVKVWRLLHYGVESHLAGVALVLLVAVAVAGLGAAWALGHVYAREKKPED
jgi:iron(III) transport system permease protein